MVTATASGGWIAEGDTGYRNLVFNVELDVVATEPVRVPWRILSGSADKIGDTQYEGGRYASGVVNFRAGETLEQVSFHPSGDFLAEPDESVVLELLPPDNAELPGGLSTYQTVGWILDDDGTPNPLALWVSDPKLVEGEASEIEFKLVLSQPAPSPISIDYSLGGSARAGQDYVDKSGTVQFGTGKSEASVVVQMKDDNAFELVEHLQLQLDLPNSIAESYGGQATIYDDDSVNSNEPIVTILGTDITEGDSSYSSMEFSIGLTKPTSQRVEVQWRIGDGTATPGSDTDYYTGRYATGTASISPGTTQTTVTVYPKGELLAEVDETFLVELTNATNASLPGNAGTLEATGWVRDDDGTAKPLALQVRNPTVRERDSGTLTASFTFELSRAAPADIKIKYETKDGSAEAGQDYVEESGTVTILKGQRTASVGVEILSDNGYESNESFRLKIDAPSSIAKVAGGTALIINDDLKTDVEKIKGTNSSETINGSSLREIIVGKGGNDRIKAGDGSDTVKGGDGRDTVYGGRGNDTIFGNDDRDSLRGDAGNDKIKGGKHNDDIRGGSGNDKLYGEDGDDKIRGDSGKDKIYGGDDDDVLTGGRSADVFYFDKKDGDNVITDFEIGKDKIVIMNGAGNFDRLDIDRHGGDVEISWKHTSVLLEDVHIRDIDDVDFGF